MKKNGSLLLLAILMAGLLLLLTSCAVTTESTEGTTDTLENTSDATTDFTSSTSPGDDHSSQAEKTRAFATVNLDRLREDMARGSGEHLASLAHLMGISEEHRQDFFELTKASYPELFRAEPVRAEDLLAGLNSELSHHPEWMRK
ncbi:MAG: DUF3015 family protein [Syntrophotaleaceae bacterium]